MAGKKIVSPRITLIPAQSASVVVVILRVRSKWWHVVKIEESGEAQSGSWFHGAKLMVDTCFLNHDGSLMSYVATSDGYGGWSGLCRPPWLKAYVSIFEPMPFGSGGSIGFPDIRTVSLPKREMLESEVFQTAKKILGHNIGNRKAAIMVNHYENIIRQRDGDSMSAADVISKELKQRVVYGIAMLSGRMERQGFIRQNEDWQWTGPDGNMRVLRDRGWAEAPTNVKHSYNCCVDSLHRWWEGIDGVVSCYDLRKKQDKPVLRFDFNQLAPPTSAQAIKRKEITR